MALSPEVQPEATQLAEMAKALRECQEAKDLVDLWKAYN